MITAIESANRAPHKSKGALKVEQRSRSRLQTVGLKYGRGSEVLRDVTPISSGSLPFRPVNREAGQKLMLRLNIDSVDSVRGRTRGGQEFRLIQP